MIRLFALCYTERYLQKYESLSYPKSHVAAAALYAAILHHETRSYILINISETGLSIAEIKPTIPSIIQKVSPNHLFVDLQATKRKYSHEKFHFVSTIPFAIL
eukprot:gene3302-6539_t